MNNFNLSKEFEKHFKLTNAGIKVGIMADAKYPDGTSVAEVAQWNNFGIQDIPPRPFMSKAISKNQDKWLNVLSNDLKKSGDYEKSLNVLGNVMTGDIKKEITDIKTPANSQETINKKGSSNPLIDTGLLRNSITFKVIK